jgi:stage II sporulation protein AA (anti-sigma F factor antagonist)
VPHTVCATAGDTAGETEIRWTDCRVVEVVGPALTYGNCRHLRHRLFDELGSGASHLALDFAGCDYIDACGLGTLVTLSKRARLAGGRIVLRNLCEDLLVLMELTQLDVLIDIERTVPTSAR